MNIESLRIAKLTGAYADSLVALGVAELLSDLGRAPGGDETEVMVKDEGDAYRITTTIPISAEALKQRSVPPGYPYIAWKGRDADCPNVGYIDYAAQREIEAAYRTLPKGKGKSTAALVMEEGSGLPARADLPVLKILNSLRAGSDSYNKLHNALRECDGLGPTVLAKLSSFDTSIPVPSGTTNLDRQLAKAVAPIQIFSPSAGKGINRAKPDGTSLGSLPDRMVDWFDEWMKYRGLHIGLLGYKAGDDTKIYVIAPGEIPVSAVRALRGELLKERMWGSLRLDISAVLNLAKHLITKSEVLSGYQSRIRLRNRTPRDAIKGLHSVFFKSLGTGSAVTNISFLGLPGWFPVRDATDANDWLTILDEHKQCISTLREDNSDHIPVLLAYRQFVSANQLHDGLEFFAYYAVHVMKSLLDSRTAGFARRFEVKNLRRLFMSYESTNKGISEIVEDEGFKNVATAVRRSTVNAQYRKARQGRSPFEIRYGLAQEWKRKVRFKEQFIAELSDFVSSYNGENARHAEQGKERREALTKQDLDSLIRLIDTHGSELVGMLLIAYGYARDAARKDDATEEPEEVSLSAG